MFKELMKSMRTMSHKIENIAEGEQLFFKKPNSFGAKKYNK